MYKIDLFLHCDCVYIQENRLPRRVIMVTNYVYHISPVYLSIYLINPNFAATRNSLRRFLDRIIHSVRLERFFH